MKTRRHTLVSLATFACTAAFVLSSCGGGGGGGASSVAKFCKDNETLSTRYASLGDAVAFDATALTRVQRLADDLEQLGNEAPSAIKPDVQQFADAMAKVANGEADSVDEDTVQAIGDRIDAYSDANCGATDASNADSSDTDDFNGESGS